MEFRYCFEIMDSPAMYYWFAYFDTHDHLADFLFSHENVSVTIEGEFAAEEDPYRIVLCRIDKKDRENFLKAVDLLPSLMEYVGKTDYNEFCQGVMRDAHRYFNAKRGNRMSRWLN